MAGSILGMQVPNGPSSVLGVNTSQIGGDVGEMYDPFGVFGGKSIVPSSGSSYTPSSPNAAYPGYAQQYNPSTMSDVVNLQKLGPQYSQGFDELRTQALNKGPSAWLNMSQLHNQMQLEDALNKGQQTSAAATAGGENALAAQGGLSSGARERMQEQGGSNLMSMDQGLQRTNQEQNLGLETQDQSNKLGQLNNLVADENTKQGQWNQAFESDVGNEMQDTAQKNQYNMNLYNTQMQTWAAGQQADATAASGKKGIGK